MACNDLDFCGRADLCYRCIHNNNPTPEDLIKKEQYDKELKERQDYYENKINNAKKEVKHNSYEEEYEKVGKIEVAEPTQSIFLITGDEIKVNTNNPFRLVVANIDYSVPTINVILIIGHYMIDFAAIDFDKLDSGIKFSIQNIVKNIQRDPEKYLVKNLFDAFVESNDKKHCIGRIENVVRLCNLECGVKHK